MFPNFRVTQFISASLADFFIIKRVDHARFHLDDSLNDEVFIDKENVAEASLASFAQAQEVIFFNNEATADLVYQWVQLGILQALPRLWTKALIKLELRVSQAFWLRSWIGHTRPVRLLRSSLTTLIILSYFHAVLIN